MGPDPTAAERGLIGSVLLTEGEALSRVNIDPADFQHPRHEALWKKFLDMRRHGLAINFVTAGEEVSKDPELSQQIHPSEVYEYTRDTPTNASATIYAQMISSAAIRRRIKAAAVAIIDQADAGGTIEALVDDARQKVDEAAKLNFTEVRPIGETIMETVEALREKPRMIPTPWDGLNHKIGGWRPGALYVIGARPGGGKSIMGAQAALDMTRYGAVTLSSLEMSEQDIHKRLIAQAGQVQMGKLMDNNINDLDYKRAADTGQRLKDAPLYVDDRSDVTMSMIRGFARSVSRRKPLAGVVVDYLQLMEAGAKKDRHLAVGALSRGLKLLARELDVPVIALSQLNRESENRQDRMPKVSDLRESGSIEQDADVILLLHREHHESDELNVGVAKNRHGAAGAFKLGWKGHYSMLTD